MIIPTIGNWMRAPGGGVINTDELARIRHLYALEKKDVDARRARRFQELLRRHEQATALGYTHKIWVSRGDYRSRHSHRSAHGQRQPIDGKFKVGADTLFLPGDPDGSLSETANCRCSVRYVRIGNPLYIPVGRGRGRRRGRNGRPLTPAESLRVAEARKLREEIRKWDPTYESLSDPTRPISQEGLRNLRRDLRRVYEENRPIKTEGEAGQVAASLGYRPTNYISKAGARIYWNGRDFISWDKTGHVLKGWKRANKISDLRSNKTRAGSWNRSLTRQVGK